MSKTIKTLLTVTLLIGLALLTTWAALALWYRLPFSTPVRAIVASLFALLGLAVMAAQFSPRRLRALATFCLALASVLFWWSTLTPPATANWAPDVSRQASGQIIGDDLTL